MTDKANILIVDDEVETVDMISFLLEGQGYTVIPAYSGEEALEILQQRTQKPGKDRALVDLVILDIKIPDMDGYEICRVIKQDDHLKYIPVIMVTGLGSVEDTARGLDIGADDYVSKPFRAEELVARVKATLRVRAMEQALLQHTRELEKSQAQLVQAEKLAAMGRLAASIAHEINNPLQAIHNCLHLTLKKPLSEEKKTRYLGMAQEEVERLITIVQRMLEFYRPSKEGMAPTDVHAIIENVLALSSKRLQRGKITVTKKLAPDLPTISIVRDQLKQVFLNLVINAIEAMPQGGELCIETKLSEGGNELSTAFTDTGVGLSEKEQENIFEPFFTTKATGTGLGLSVSYGIIERHGGRIEVQSELGKGATFTVHLPLNSPT
jgi:signal transduction histidine kinase